MLHIEGNTIKLTRGDTAYLTVPIKSATGEEYALQNGDTLVMSVKKTVNDAKYALQKLAVNGNTIHIEPADTAQLEFGKYKYDLQLNKANGDVYTLIEVDTFEILQEVTC
jgi:hypothetical protein